MSDKTKRTDQENQLLEKLRRCRSEISRLEYESDILSLQGKQEASYKKARAAELGKQHFRKLSAEYRRLWKRRRRICYNALYVRKKL
ncbi:hypothetical protein COU78_04970 [Candidatus Peregrinibacteria bacterium CG10_big_fil_rev_8_21_14_0_10_49_24]|nr:MAG: hypothetical protein COU78_04970 [Candidatus Peregrinibacteria bacterium CG10_big_fil_rev_8_21_14_0_10_49_24]